MAGCFANATSLGEVLIISDQYEDFACKSQAIPVAKQAYLNSTAKTQEEQILCCKQNMHSRIGSHNACSA